MNAPHANVYRALLDARAIATWMVPFGMISHVRVFDAREGGLFRISLTYGEPTRTGKTTAHTDAYHGHFVKLVPNEQVVEVMEFEMSDARWPQSMSHSAESSIAQWIVMIAAKPLRAASA